MKNYTIIIFFLLIILLFNCADILKTNYGTITIVNNSTKNILYKGEYVDDYYGEWEEKEENKVIVPDEMWKYRFEKTVLDKIEKDTTTDTFIRSVYSIQGHKYILKKDATENDRNEIKNILKEIDKKFPEGQDISPNDIKGQDNLDIKYAITEYLSCMERFAAGIKINIYDINVFNQMIGATLTREWHKKFIKIIKYFQDEYKNINLYKDLNDLVKKLGDLPEK